MTFESVAAKLEIVRENLERLEALPQSSFAEFSADFRNLDSALHRLQTAIQALIDVASYIVSVRGLGVPKTSLDALEKLEAARLLPQGSVERRVSQPRRAPLRAYRSTNRVSHPHAQPR